VIELEIDVEDVVREIRKQMAEPETNVTSLQGTRRPDKELAAEYRAELLEALEEVCDILNRGRADGLMIRLQHRPRSVRPGDPAEHNDRDAALTDHKDIPSRDRHPTSPTDGETAEQTLERMGEVDVRMHLESNGLPEYLILPARRWLAAREREKEVIHPSFPLNDHSWYTLAGRRTG